MDPAVDDLVLTVAMQVSSVVPTADAGLHYVLLINQDAAAPSTTAAAPAPARFVISAVSLGDFGKVVITNLGPEAGSLAGHYLCQRPLYYEFPDVTLQPMESASVSLGAEFFVPEEGSVVIDGVAGIGPFDPLSGEVGLYSGDGFSRPEQILSYLEWGESGHGRSETAIAAGIWPEGGFVPTNADTGAILAITMPSSGPDDWTTGG